MHPTSVDFIDAVISGASALEKAEKLPLPFDDVRRMILNESVRRNMIPPQGGRTVFTAPVKAIGRLREQYLQKGPVRFRKVGGAPYLGGRTEIFQQQVLLQRLRTEDGTPLKLDVVGHGFFAWHTEGGIEVALQDIRPLRRGSIIEKVNRTPQEALDYLSQRLNREIRLSEEKLNLLGGWRKDEEAKRRLLLQRAQESIREKETEVEMQLVAMRGKRYLYYEVQLNGGTHYVPAYLKGSHKPLHHKMVFGASGRVKAAA
ncbi:MAG: hypothetical protein HYY44_09540 [Deltaproteobacteria bacterium]|nr:hypothetical protein [Deltaproteobacteria bacterium]